LTVLLLVLVVCFPPSALGIRVDAVFCLSLYIRIISWDFSAVRDFFRLCWSRPLHYDTRHGQGGFFTASHFFRSPSWRGKRLSCPHYYLRNISGDFSAGRNFFICVGLVPSMTTYARDGAAFYSEPVFSAIWVFRFSCARRCGIASLFT